MSLSVKEKELVSVGVSLAAGCKPCTDYHLKKVRGAGASDEEIEQAMTDAIAVRDKAKMIMQRHGLKLLGFKKTVRTEDDDDELGEPTRMRELVAVGAAYAVSCTSSLEEHVAAARSVGVEESEIEAVVGLARFIRGKADSLCCKLI
ncbi:MAG: carboxymuconolactone decarboxylase family protein [Planctomycetota bacterium]|jgi:AhpD family alkylhydroperoxidase